RDRLCRASPTIDVYVVRWGSRRPRGARPTGSHLHFPERLHLDRLDDQPAVDGRGRYPHLLHHAVHDAPHLLEVRLELAPAGAGDLLADAAEVLRLTAVGILVAERGLPAGEHARLGHDRDLSVVPGAGAETV